MSTENLNEEHVNEEQLNEESLRSLISEIPDFKEAEEDSSPVLFYKELKREYDAALEKVYKAVAKLRKPSPPSIFEWVKILLKGEQDSDNGAYPDLLEITGLEDVRRVVEDAPVAIAKHVGERYPNAPLNLLSHIRPLFRLEQQSEPESGELNAAACYAEIKKSLEELKSLKIRKRRVYSIGISDTLRSLPDAGYLRAVITGARKWSWIAGVSAGFLIGWVAAGKIDPKQAELLGSIAGGLVGVIIAAALLFLNERKASEPVYIYFDNIKHLRPALETSFLQMFNVVAEHVGLNLEDQDRKEIEKMRKDALKAAQEEPLLVHFLQIQTRRYGRHSLKLVETLRKLNDISQEQFRFQDAEQYLQHILEIYDNQEEPDLQLTVDILHRLARLCYRMKDHSKAEAHLLRALGIRVEQSSNILEKVDPLLRLATTYKRWRKRNKERETLEEALRICEEEAPNHMLAALTMNRLAAFYRRKHDFEKEGDFLTRSLAILEEWYPDSCQTVDALHRLAMFRKKMRNLEAKSLLERALAISEKRQCVGGHEWRKRRTLNAIDRLEKKKKKRAP